MDVEIFSLESCNVRNRKSTALTVSEFVISTLPCARRPVSNVFLFVFLLSSLSPLLSDML